MSDFLLVEVVNHIADTRLDASLLVTIDSQLRQEAEQRLHIPLRNQLSDRLGWLVVDAMARRAQSTAAKQASRRQAKQMFDPVVKDLAIGSLRALRSECELSYDPLSELWDAVYLRLRPLAGVLRREALLKHQLQSGDRDE